MDLVGCRLSKALVELGVGFHLSQKLGLAAPCLALVEGLAYFFGDRTGGHVFGDGLELVFDCRTEENVETPRGVLANLDSEAGRYWQVIDGLGADGDPWRIGFMPL